MAFINGIHQLKDRFLHVAIFDAFFLFLPGIAVLFKYERELVTTLNWVTLVLLAGSITVPVCFINLLYFSDTSNFIDSEDRYFLNISLAIFGSALSIYLALGISYWKHFSFTVMLLTIIPVNIFVWLGDWYDRYKLGKIPKN